MASKLPALVLAKLGLIDWQRWGQGMMVESLSLLRDMTPEKFEEVSEWLIEKDLPSSRKILQSVEEYLHSEKGRSSTVAFNRSRLLQVQGMIRTVSNRPGEAIGKLRASWNTFRFNFESARRLIVLLRQTGAVQKASEACRELMKLSPPDRFIRICR